MQLFKNLLISFIVLVASLSCEYKTNKNDYPVAKVFDKELMFSEITQFLPKGTSKEDSILMARNYISNWITKQLLVNKAIQNLSPSDKNIDRLVEDYRTSLLIHNYKQKLIAQKLKKEITEDEIEKYYEANKYNFILPTPVVKAIYFVLPKSAGKLNMVRRWFKSDEARDIESLEEYCISTAKKFDNFQNKWVELKFILNLMPQYGDPAQLEKEAMRTKHIEREDDENYYFLKITEIANSQTVAPIGYVRDEIILILKNKIKMDFEIELENQINSEAIRKNYVKIY
ncbi:MAG: peptidyl-prolyl cis-trans isomerase [Culturomica sp.]|jgi:hypothetical protein|nr:peptidyl-prolyl cis-trans isomerase [Culturomica sp.]